jgi:hypothetical protein
MNTGSATEIMLVAEVDGPGGHVQVGAGDEHLHTCVAGPFHDGHPIGIELRVEQIHPDIDHLKFGLL